MPESTRSRADRSSRSARRYQVAPDAGRTIALTFDDGPDPTWTPKILDVLPPPRPRDFFVVGSQVAAQPGTGPADRRRGQRDRRAHLHPPRSGQRRRPGGAAGVLADPDGARRRHRGDHDAAPAAVLVTTDAVDDRGLALVEDGRRGYLTVFERLDSQDWQRPGVDAIVRNATPRAARRVVLMHDAGGDRSQTVAALDAHPRPEGARLPVRDHLRGARRLGADRAANAGDGWRGAALRWRRSLVPRGRRRR